MAMHTMDMDSEEVTIVGTAEPLTPEQTRRRLRELQAWGVDLSLIRRNLQLTPTQCMEEALRLQEFAEEIRRGMQRARVAGNRIVPPSQPSKG